MKPAPKFPQGYIPHYREVAGTDYCGEVRMPSLSDLPQPKEQQFAAESDGKKD